MIGGKQAATFSVFQLGELNRAEIENAVGLANQVQGAFTFDFHDKPVQINKKQYRLSNGGFDLDAAAQQASKQVPPGNPAIFITSLPYGDPNSPEKGYFFFWGYVYPPGRAPVYVISTQLWTSLPGTRDLQPYVISMLAVTVLSHFADLEFHGETSGCLFDYCDDESHIDEVFKGDGLCDSCERILYSSARRQDVSLSQVAAAKRLFNRSKGRKVCFLVMPFQDSFNAVHKVVRKTMEDKSWIVRRADDFVRPRTITDAITLGIMESDLVVADITRGNPNVFYEIGLAHAFDKDIIIITQDEPPIPFDIAHEQAIFYKTGKGGLAGLSSALGRGVGSGKFSGSMR